MERISRVVGPVATNVHVLADARTREAIAIDTAIPSLAWIADELAARDWTLKLIVSTHGHWDHIGRQRRGPAAHRRRDRGPSARPRPPRAPGAALGAVRDPAVRPGGRARRGRRGPVRRDPAAGAAHAGPHARARSASTPPTRACSSAATRCSPPAGAGPTCRAATRTAIVESLVRLLDARGPDRASCPATAARRRSGRSGPGWSSCGSAGRSSASAARGYGPLTKPVVLTTSNIEPVIPWRPWRSSSFQCGSGAPVM